MNKNILILCALLIACMGLQAKGKQEVRRAQKPIMAFQTTIYTDSTLTDELVEEEYFFDDGERGFGKDILNLLGNAAINAATGYVSTVVDLGIQAIGKLIMMDRQHKEEWTKTALQECSYTSSLGTLYAINDFYATGSNKGALDPSGFQFNGVGCLATVGQDTSFYVSCHLNRQKLNRLRDHSKFELIPDTIIIAPYHSHLPNTTLPLKFSFAERKSFNFKMTIQLKSSWLDETPVLHKDEVLGEFILDVPIDSSDVDNNGRFVYIREKGQQPKYQLLGESFIVPRSYMQLLDNESGVHNHYGTGQYSVNIAVEESCELTEDYQKNWRKDRKYRKELSKADKKKATFDEVWKTMTNQTWDESLKSWVVTILKAPADYSIKTMKEELQKKHNQAQ